jgi:hypothetical protein
VRSARSAAGTSCTGFTATIACSPVVRRRCHKRWLCRASGGPLGRLAPRMTVYFVIGSVLVVWALV